MPAMRNDERVTLIFQELMISTADNRGKTAQQQPS
jgi:hypothetical protein